ncbi:hypothetical protein [Pandoraea anhela]|uniref:hypothetical protein n=1 Tax=Pandoraea anhela TaxID=2508295 RepID=UPI0012400AF6|nr:hypothetical protein [Pandoraea anhela]
MRAARIDQTLRRRRTQRQALRDSTQIIVGNCQGFALISVEDHTDFRLGYLWSRFAVLLCFALYLTI